MRVDFTQAEIDLLDAAMVYWLERIEWTTRNERSPPSVHAAGRLVRKHLKQLRDKIAHLVTGEAK